MKECTMQIRQHKCRPAQPRLIVYHEIQLFHSQLSYQVLLQRLSFILKQSGILLCLLYRVYGTYIAIPL